LLNIAIGIWWLLDAETTWKWIKDRLGSPRSLPWISYVELNCLRPLWHIQLAKNFRKYLSGIRNRKEQLQIVLFVSSDTQLVTGLALATAGLWQFYNAKLTTYHMCLISDLLSVSANGQSVVLFFAIRSKGKLDKWEYLSYYSLRILIYFAYLAIYFIWSACLLRRFSQNRNGEDCYFNGPPQLGNYGIWSFAEAGLLTITLVVSFAQQWLPKQVSISYHMLYELKWSNFHRSSSLLNGCGIWFTITYYPFSFSVISGGMLETLSR
jgi:hypothetical protein